jgi:hypothetical protein
MKKHLLWLFALLLMTACGACSSDNQAGDGTYRDLYLYCAQHTLGSHVGIYNYTNFGNLYTTSPKDFFVKRNY